MIGWIRRFAVVRVRTLVVEHFRFVLDRRLVHHGNDGHRHVGSHDVRVGHSEEQHEHDIVPRAEAPVGLLEFTLR